jgi:ribose 5-phosphate isomerase RpiB
MNIPCIGGRTVGRLVAWDFVETFLKAKFSQEPRQLGPLGKVARAEAEKYC